MSRVLVCGGRDLDVTTVWNWLEANLRDAIAEKLGGLRPITDLIHGGARGADEGAGKWAMSEHQINTHVFRADWKKHGKAAGPMRNQRMIDEGRPDCVVAFPGGRGTADMVRRAENADIPVIRATPARPDREVGP